jgi:hypothetical protein
MERLIFSLFARRSRNSRFACSLETRVGNTRFRAAGAVEGPCGETSSAAKLFASGNFSTNRNYRWYELRRNGDRVSMRHARPRPSNFRRRQQDGAQRIGEKPLGSAIRGDTVRLYCSPTPEFRIDASSPTIKARGSFSLAAYLSEQSGASGNLDFDFAPCHLESQSSLSSRL